MNEMETVAYAIENHPNDSRVKMDKTGTVQALTSRMVTGGGNTPMVLIPVIPPECMAIDSHPQDSRMQIAEGACPSLTVKLAKMASDGPLMLIRRNR